MSDKRKRVLVLGATGMLGHKLVQILSKRYQVAGTVRDPWIAREDVPRFAEAQLVSGVTAEDLDSVRHAVDTVRPDVVINGIGAIKHTEVEKDSISYITINALFPNQIARLCADRRIRFLHFSTDCVFSGHRGPYTEDDLPDPVDLYGRTKLLGEVSDTGCLTVRTSIIGRELRGRASLLEWFLSHKSGRVKGFVNALYTGLTTNAMAELVGDLISDFPDLNGIWHVASEPISKYELLKIVNSTYDLGITIDRDEEFACDRRLNSNRFQTRTGFRPRTWEQMISEMYADPARYGCDGR